MGRGRGPGSVVARDTETGQQDGYQLYLGQGYSSLWDYCRRALHFSESISQQRIVVARAARLYPDLLALLGDGRLTHISPEGVRCNETRFLTIDHIQPYALGGTSTDQSNLRSMCNSHNGYLGRLVFGPRQKVPHQATRQDG